jgi:hypothetical protein
VAHSPEWPDESTAAPYRRFGKNAKASDAIEQHGALMRAAAFHADNDPQGEAAFKQACKLEWEIAEMPVSTVACFYAKVEAIRSFTFDDEDLLGMLFQLGVEAG